MQHPIPPLLALLAAALAPPQDAPAPAAPVPDGVAAVVGEDVITMEAYEDHLVRIYGRRPLRVLVDRLLVERAAAARGIEVTDAEVDAAVERAWQSFLQRFRGDEAAFVRDLEAGGRRVDEYRAELREEARAELLAQALCRATRVIGEAEIAERFLRDYGRDGEKVEVRQILLTPARMRADLLRDGASAADLTPEVVERRILEEVDEILAVLEGGADFGALARERSHDLLARRADGVLPGYNYLTYGEPFAAAVQAAEVGRPVGPVRTSAGFHVIEVVSRVRTQLADVRDELAAALAEEPASYAEVEALRERLRAETPVRTF